MNDITAAASPKQRANVTNVLSKQEKLRSVSAVINSIAAHLVAYLPIANAHMTDFIVCDHWDKFLTDAIQSDLLELVESDLASLPSGQLYSEHILKENIQIDHERVGSFVISGQEEVVLGGAKCKWDVSLSPKWCHDNLEDFIVSCQRCSLPHCGLMKRVSDLLQTDNPDDLVPIIEFMSVKKSHEVEIMTEVCARLAEQCGLTHMIDLGSGKGYLGSHLALKHGMRVLGVDSSQTNTEGAVGRSERLGKQWRGLVNRSQLRKEGQQVKARRTRKNRNQNEQMSESVNRGITAGIASAKDPVPEANTVRNEGVFVPVTMFVDKTTDLQGMLCTHLIPSIEGEASTVPAEPCEQLPWLPGDGRSDPRTSSDDYASATSLRETRPESMTMNISDHPRVTSIPFLMGGLHACGDLSSNTLRLFVDHDEARLLCNVGCCYHHLTEAFVQCPFGKDEGLESDAVGFPMSEYLRSRGCQLGRNARMVASQAPDRIAHAEKAPSVSLFWRALLQVILRDLTGQLRADWQVGRIAAKCTDFTSYVNRALDKLGLENKLTAEDIRSYEDRYAAYRPLVQCFVQLKSSLAPCIEALILLDRLSYLLEQDCVTDADVVQVFDPLTSPRCYALVAWK